MDIKTIGIVEEEKEKSQKDSLATRLIQDFNHYYVKDKMVERIYYFNSDTVPYQKFVQAGRLDVLLFMSEKMIDEAREIKSKFPQLKVIVFYEELPLNEVVCIKASKLILGDYLELLK